MKNFSNFILGLGAIGLVSACGNGTEITRVTPPDSGNQIVAASTADVTGKALADGQTLEGLEVAALSLNYNTGETSVRDGDTVKITRNSAGEITANFNGKDFVFSNADRQVSDDGKTYSYNMTDAQGRGTSLWTWTGGELDDLLDANGTGYMRVLGGQTNAINADGVTEPNFRFMTLVGAMTAADTLPGLATANYTGEIRVDLYPDTGFVNNETSRDQVRGDLNMTADFAAGTISGVASKLQNQEPMDTNFVDIPGNLLFGNAAISGNTFGGQVSGDSQLVEGGTLAGTYKGGFYGPNAEQVGAVMTMTGTNSAGEVYPRQWIWCG